MLLRQTQVMAEVGQKGEADVAQMQATYATDDFEVTHQQGLYDNAILSLKSLMNYPVDQPLKLTDYDTEYLIVAPSQGQSIFEQAKLCNPDIKSAEFSLLSA